MLWMLIPAAVVATVAALRSGSSGEGDSVHEVDRRRQAAIDKARREEAERSRKAFREDTVKQAMEQLLALTAAHPDVFVLSQQAPRGADYDTLIRWFGRMFDTPGKALANLSEIFPGTKFSDKWEESNLRIAEAEREINELKKLKEYFEDVSL